MSNKNLFLKITFLSLLLTVILQSCKKEILNKQSEISNMIQPFKVDEISLNKIKDEFKANLKKTKLDHEFREKCGIPLWNKSIYLPKRVFSKNDSPSDTIVIIPLITANNSKIESFLKAKFSDSISIELKSSEQYKNLDFSTSQMEINEAEKLAIQFMLLNKEVFGENIYRIKDKRLFHGSINYIDTFDIERQVLLRASYMEICVDVTTTTTTNRCPYPPNQCPNIETGIPGPCDGCINCTTASSQTTVYCGSWWDDNDGSSSGNSSSGPSGSGSGTSSSGNSGGTNTSPCDGSSIQLFGQYLPCITSGPGGWTPLPIDENGFIAERVIYLTNYLQNKSWGLLPCDKLAAIEAYGAMFQRIAQFTPSQSVINRLNNIREQNTTLPFDDYNIQSLTNAFGKQVNCDFFPLRITDFPYKPNTTDRFTPAELLEYFRLHINDFISPSLGINFSCNYSSYNFNDCLQWNQPSVSSAGSILHIDMVNDGSVILSDYQNIFTSLGSQKHYFKFSTLETPFDYEHPVAGNREFGLYNTNLNFDEFTFYTMGVDRIWDWSTALGDLAFNGFEQADNLWLDIQQNFKNFINLNYGYAQYYGERKYISRPNWEDVKDYLQGRITFTELKTLLGCN